MRCGPAYADESLCAGGGAEAEQALYLLGVGPEDGDGAEAAGLRHHQAAPARPCHHTNHINPHTVCVTGLVLKLQKPGKINCHKTSVADP
jgi:hypothetical protein